ncbi:MAG: sulfur carrier protein ThiS [Verrucomicrobia bacterium]|nr:sulfur carrier protein ThiS [Verrucomicrobiota bacterium]
MEQFLTLQGLLPRSVVVEHNGEAVAPSEFAERQLQAGDRLEIVRIVAGG